MVAGTGKGVPKGTRPRTGMGTRTGMGAGTGVGTGTRVDLNVEGRYTLGAYEVVIEVGRKAQEGGDINE